MKPGVLVVIPLLVLFFSQCNRIEDKGLEGPSPDAQIESPISLTASVSEEERLVWIGDLEKNVAQGGSFFNAPFFETPFIETGVPGNGARAAFSMKGEVVTSPDVPKISVMVFDPATNQGISPGVKGSTFSLDDGYLPIPRIRWPIGGSCDAEIELIPLLAGKGMPQGEAETFYSLKFRFYNPGSEQRNIRLMINFGPHARMGSDTGVALAIEGRNVIVNDRTTMRFTDDPSRVGYLEADGIDENKPAGWEPTPPEADSAMGRALCSYDLTLNPVSGSFAHAAPCAELGLVIAAVPGAEFPSPKQIDSRIRRTRIFWKHDSGVGQPSFQIPHRGFCDAFHCAVSTLMLAWQGVDSDTAGKTSKDSSDSMNEATINASAHASASNSPADLAMAIIALNRAGQLEAAASIADQLLAQQKRGKLVDPEQTRLDDPDDSAIRTRGLFLYAMDDLYRFRLDRFGEDRAWLDNAYAPVQKAADALLTPAQALLESDSEGGKDALFPHLFETNWAIHGLNAAAHLVAATGNAPKGREYAAAAQALNTRLRDRFEQSVKENRLSLFIADDESASPRILNSGLSSLLFPEPLLEPRWSHVVKLYDQVLGLHESSPGKTAISDGALLHEPVELVLSMVRLNQSEWVLRRLQELIDAPLISGAWFWPEVANRVEKDATQKDVAEKDSDKRSGEEKPEDPKSLDARRHLMPSCRVAAAYVIAFRSLFVQEYNESIILAQGLPEKWYDYQQTTGIVNAPTRFGPVSFSLFCEGLKAELKLDSTASPMKGFALVPVGALVEPNVVLIDGKQMVADYNFKRLRQVPFPAGTEQVFLQW